MVIALFDVISNCFSFTVVMRQHLLAVKLLIQMNWVDLKGYAYKSKT